MHSKNKLINGYNFLSLVEEFPLLKPFLFYNKYDKPSLDFSNQKCVLLFNQALLKKHYQIDYWHLPDVNLCPTIPGRADYIHYLSDIIGNTPQKILDIGTGASVIYPLLGQKLFNWSFVATDINKDSLNSAKNILTQNHFKEDQIELRLQKDRTSILHGVVLPTDTFDACICNPPFFESKEQALNWNQKKWSKGLSKKEQIVPKYIGTHDELIYKGGEKAFISKMIQESVDFRGQIKYFTCLVSKKSSISFIEKACKEVDSSSLEFIEMKTGRKISRLAVWTF